MFNRNGYVLDFIRGINAKGMPTSAKCHSLLILASAGLMERGEGCHCEIIPSKGGREAVQGSSNDLVDRPEGSDRWKPQQLKNQVVSAGVRQSSN